MRKQTHVHVYTCMLAYARMHPHWHAYTYMYTCMCTYNAHAQPQRQGQAQRTSPHASTRSPPEQPPRHKEETFAGPDDGIGVAPKNDRSTISQ